MTDPNHSDYGGYLFYRVRQLYRVPAGLTGHPIEVSVKDKETLQSQEFCGKYKIRRLLAGVPEL